MAAQIDGDSGGWMNTTMPNPHTPRRAPRSVRVGVLLALLVALTALGAHAQAAHGGRALC
jgi:hypothetical protein